MAPSLLLAVDIGNSHTVIGAFKAQSLVRQWRLQTSRLGTADELAAALHALLVMEGLSRQDFNGLVLCSVVPSLEPTWLKLAEQHLHGLASSPVVVSHRTDAGIALRTANPAELGPDRIVNAAAAWACCRSALIVVDFGTAITFDCVSAQAEHLGGTIHPGLGISLDALVGRTAKLPRVSLDERPAAVIGTSTIDAIRSGMLHGFGGLTDRMVSLLANEMQTGKTAAGPVEIVATGGMASLVAPYSTAIRRVDPFLTLNGLQMIHERSRKESL